MAVRTHVVRDMLGPYRGQTYCGRRVNLGLGERAGYTTGRGGPCEKCWRSWRHRHGKTERPMTLIPPKPTTPRWQQ